MRVFIGIDPGASGGIAWVSPDDAAAMKMPPTEADIYAEIAALITCDVTLTVIERVGAMPGQGVSSTFKFGVSYGGLRMALVAALVRFEAVAPRVWQKEFGLVFPKKMGLTITQKKNRHKARAQELFPDLEITHATADALLLAEYARRWWSRNHTGG